MEPECEEQSIEYYRDYFWKVLQYLHENDDQTWPKQIPEDPITTYGNFHLAGNRYLHLETSHKQRKTRHLGNSRY